MRHPQEALDAARARADVVDVALRRPGPSGEVDPEDVVVADATSAVLGLVCDLGEAIVAAIERNTEALKK